MPTNRPASRKPLSPTEWRLIQVCWRRGRATIREMLDDLADEAPVLSYYTARVLLDRMIEKGYVALEHDDGRRPYYFVPIAPRDETVRQAVRSFVGTVLGREPENLRILEEVLAEAPQMRSLANAGDLRVAGKP